MDFGDELYLLEDFSDYRCGSEANFSCYDGSGAVAQPEFVSPLREDDQNVFTTLGEPIAYQQVETPTTDWSSPWQQPDPGIISGSGYGSCYSQHLESPTLPSMNGPLTPASLPDCNYFFHGYDSISPQTENEMILPHDPFVNDRSVMIKGCLKLRIDEKRKARGESPIDCIPIKEELPDPELNSWEDEERRRRRRERNKVAAAKCRNKKKQHAKILDWESVHLRQENQLMREEKKKLEIEVYQLQRCLSDHSCMASPVAASCPNSSSSSIYSQQPSMHHHLNSNQQCPPSSSLSDYASCSGPSSSAYSCENYPSSSWPYR